MRNFRYGIIGKGKWGKKIAHMLAEQSKPVYVFDISRPSTKENKAIYKTRINKYISQKAKDIDIIWIAVPPEDQYVLAQSALEHDKHVIVEKPWMCNENETDVLIKIARRKQLSVGIDYQYCFFDEIPDIRAAVNKAGKEIKFSGEFKIKEDNRLSLPPIYNLGSHLLAVKVLFFPKALVEKIVTAYNSSDQRRIEIFSEKKYEIDFLNNTQPLLQRFIDSFEKSILESKKFPLDLEFALKVNSEITKLNNPRSY
jgi:predicted dehydrogenase